MESGICHQHALITNVMLFTVGDPANLILHKEYWPATGLFQSIHRIVKVLVLLTSRKYCVRTSRRINLKKNKCHLVEKAYQYLLMTGFISNKWLSKPYFHPSRSQVCKRKEVVYFKTVRAICWGIQEISTETLIFTRHWRIAGIKNKPGKIYQLARISLHKIFSFQITS